MTSMIQKNLIYSYKVVLIETPILLSSPSQQSSPKWHQRITPSSKSSIHQIVVAIGSRGKDLQHWKSWKRLTKIKLQRISSKKLNASQLSLLSTIIKCRKKAVLTHLNQLTQLKSDSQRLEEQLRFKSLYKSTWLQKVTRTHQMKGLGTWLWGTGLMLDIAVSVKTNKICWLFPQ
jgi:hypothetical protein